MCTLSTINIQLVGFAKVLRFHCPVLESWGILQRYYNRNTWKSGGIPLTLAVKSAPTVFLQPQEPKFN